MADRPIIFSAPMVRALLAGRKTQTRLALKPQPDQMLARPTHFVAVGRERRGGQFAVWEAHDQRGPVSSFRGPPGCIECYCKTVAKGDYLWVRETCGRQPASFLGIEATNGVESAFYLADENDVLNPQEFNLCPWWRGKTCSPIHMPRWVSRLTLTVTEVRVQRLQDISREDVIAEGITKRDGCPIEDVWAGWHEPYAKLWDDLHGEGAWAANPWVAALTFAVHHGNIDALSSAADQVSQAEAAECADA